MLRSKRRWLEIVLIHILKAVSLTFFIARRFYYGPSHTGKPGICFPRHAGFLQQSSSLAAEYLDVDTDLFASDDGALMWNF
ncbi:hypothetical protein N7468_002934 [Penicillium chermesinum]|uniref:Uncharacterized protein n=1 Tax=Penicillium chermesinum TaxID=63820 RepID=A0A9W9TR42_9EURO|nr:uncharacterized protein N7468_002934 [Penicillium chermesinum]KAJ5238315.1 hypothetical protein N7468_002934 [Penicillium chermesinum]KAJ6163982.1 hypothetical protein N7470_002654 [Penicillium chermesinum]